MTRPIRRITHKSISVSAARFPLWLLIAVCFMSAALCMWQIIINRGACALMGDYWSYEEAWNSLQQIRLSDIRPPVYPILLGLLYTVFGKVWGLVVLCALQWVLYAASMLLVWHICTSLHIRRGIIIAVIVSYFLLPCIWAYNNVALPESLSGCLLLTLAGAGASYAANRSGKAMWTAGAALLLLIFTKPMFICLLPVMALWWIFAIAGMSGPRRRSAALSAVTITAFTLALIWGYADGEKSQYGVRMLAKSTLLNRYATLRMSGIISTEAADSIPSITDIWTETRSMTPLRLAEINDSAVAANPDETVMAYRRQMSAAIVSPHFEQLCDRKGNILDPSEYPGWTCVQPRWYFYPFHGLFAHIPVWAGLVLGGLFTMLWCATWAYTRHIPLTASLIAMSYFSLTITTMAGAPNDWGRILIPVSFILPIMAASVAEYVGKLFSLLKNH